MTLWLDMLGAEIRFVDTRSFGRVRIAEAGRNNKEPLLFLHGIGGHLEAYARNVVPLSDQFHTIAYDYVGHGLSQKKPFDSPLFLVEHLGELLDALGLERANLSGESLGGWVAGLFAAHSPQRVKRIMLNTSAGIPIATEKGRADLEALKALSAKNVQQAPSMESVRARMQWLFHPKNQAMITDELVATRLRFYSLPEMREVMPAVLSMIPRHDEFLIPLEKIGCETLFLWTLDNPVHDVESARKACAKVAKGQLYLMKGDSAHWPQFEQPEEFNEVTRRFFTTGRIEP